MHLSLLVLVLPGYACLCWCTKCMYAGFLTAGCCLVQDANKSLEHLETLRGTLQPESGIHMHCTERGKREE